MQSPRDLSLWWDGLGEPIPHRPTLSSDLDVDVVVVGGGFSGLWSAYSLLVNEPTLRVAVVEREVVGFGASGRNGGWASALFPTDDAPLVRRYGLAAARRLRRAMHDAIDALGAIAEREDIDCRFHKGGTVRLARNRAQVARARAEVADAHELGVIDEGDLRWLDADEARAVVAASDVLGATYTPHCAAIDPVRLVRGLAEAFERRGGTIYEGTVVRAIEERSALGAPRVRCERGDIRAEVVVRAVEAWTTTLESTRRALVPLYSLMVATEPLSEERWREIGLERRETFADHRHFIVYGQRTADGRFAFGGRGAPYHFGSRIDPSYDRDDGVHAMLERTLVELFPMLGGVGFTHRWGGPLGVPRDWMASVGYDARRGIAWAGGYVGDGVTTSSLAGRTVADLICSKASDLTTLAWVTHVSRRWEPEPLRWLGINAGMKAVKYADRHERRRGEPSKVAAAIAPFIGG